MSVNLDEWRGKRDAMRRADDVMIDALCDMVLNGQNRIKELEAQLATNCPPVPTNPDECRLIPLRSLPA